jgi:PAS domain-containing protein
MTFQRLVYLALILVIMTFALSFAWKFGVEELVDPYLIGDHLVESDAERWEFVIVSTLMVALAVATMLLIGHRAYRRLEHRQWLETLITEGFMEHPTAGFVMDDERRIVLENSACRDLAGPDLGVLVGRSFKDLYPMDLTDAQYLSLELSLRERDRWRGNLKCVGTNRPVQLNIELVLRRGEDGVATSHHAWIHEIGLLPSDNDPPGT